MGKLKKLVGWIGLAIIIFLPEIVLGQSNQEVLAYIEKYKTIAIQEMKRAKIPASITLAQGIHESGAGTSVLCKNTNNHFGIKCHADWTGKGYRHDDDAPKECFRVYDDPYESFIDHSVFLHGRKWYQPLFALPINDYKAWAHGLKKAGYATNPKYPQIIIKTIEDFQLWRFDLDSTIIIDSTARENTPNDNVVNVPAKMDTPAFMFQRIKVNGVNGIVWDGKLPIQNVADILGLSTVMLYQYNDLDTRRSFKKGETIYIEPKKEESDYWQYEIGQNETLRDISQKFGVKLASICSKNKVQPDDMVDAGEVLVLRGEREVPLRASAIKRGNSNSNITDTKNTLYTVQSGDTLYQLAIKFKVTMAQLRSANKLTSDLLSKNQQLIIP